MQKIKNKKYYTKHLSSPSDVRDLGKHGLDCQELLRSILDPETTHTLYDGQWMMVVDDGVMVVVGGGWSVREVVCQGMKENETKLLYL